MDAARAIGDVRRVGDLLMAHAVNPLVPLDFWKARLPVPKLVALGSSDAARAVATVNGMFAQLDDGLCFGRGVFGAARIQEMLDGGIAGLDDAMHAATAVVNSSHPQTGWYFHAAPVYRSAEDGGLHVIDGLQGRASGGVMTLDAWARSVGRTAEDVRVQHPLDNEPMAPGSVTGPLTRGKLADYRDRLVASIARAAR